MQALIFVSCLSPRQKQMYTDSVLTLLYTYDLDYKNGICGFSVEQAGQF
jgi:hypothetical protein